MGPHGNGAAARKCLRTCRKKRHGDENANSATMTDNNESRITLRLLLPRVRPDTFRDD